MFEAILVYIAASVSVNSDELCSVVFEGLVLLVSSITSVSLTAFASSSVGFSEL